MKRILIKSTKVKIIAFIVSIVIYCSCGASCDCWQYIEECIAVVVLDNQTEDTIAMKTFCTQMTWDGIREENIRDSIQIFKEYFALVDNVIIHEDLTVNYVNRINNLSQNESEQYSRKGWKCLCAK